MLTLLAPQALPGDSQEVNLHGSRINGKSGSILPPNPGSISPPTMSFLEKLRAMFASVQNWLAFQLILVKVLHCQSVALSERHVTSGYTTALGVMRESWLLIFPADISA